MNQCTYILKLIDHMPPSHNVNLCIMAPPTSLGRKGVGQMGMVPLSWPMTQSGRPWLSDPSGRIMTQQQLLVAESAGKKRGNQTCRERKNTLKCESFHSTLIRFHPTTVTVLTYYYCNIIDVDHVFGKKKKTFSLWRWLNVNVMLLLSRQPR